MSLQRLKVVRGELSVLIQLFFAIELTKSYIRTFHPHCVLCYFALTSVSYVYQHISPVSEYEGVVQLLSSAVLSL